MVELPLLRSPSLDGANLKSPELELGRLLSNMMSQIPTSTITNKKAPSQIHIHLQRSQPILFIIQKLQHIKTIFMLRRIPMLRRKPVINRHHNRRQLPRKPSANGVVRNHIRRQKNKTAAVEEYDDR
ncbi:hypothetical protein Hanom_Chr09g00778501 [Helianthus anomalus]